MRTPLPLSLRLGMPFVCAIAALPFTSALSGQTSTNVDYTGSLMGYYRMEFNETTHLPPVDSFLNYRQRDHDLLLGMGDNFGPEFGAALQLENKGNACELTPKTTPTGETQPESLYKDDDRSAVSAQCDNVLNFLIHAGFRAVVPGTQDFMYTARWLRVSALLLSAAHDDPAQSAQINNLDRQVNLLGANLRVAVKGGGQKGGGGGARCPLLFSQNPLAPTAFRCVGDGTQPEQLDWLDRLDRLNREGGQNSTVSAIQALASDSVMQVAARESALDEVVHDEVAILQAAWGSRLLPLHPDKSDPAKTKDANQAISELVGKKPFTADTSIQLAAVVGDLQWADARDHSAGADDQKEFVAYRDRLKIILANFGARLQNSSTPNSPGHWQCPQEKDPGGCFLLTPEARASSIRGLLRTVALEERNAGYTVAQSATGGKVLIVGVVGVETMQAASETNLRLCPDNTKRGDPINSFGSCGDRTTAGSGDEVMVSDPVAITQALVRGANLVDGPFESVVVMAQMPHTEAEILSERVWKRLSLANDQLPSAPAANTAPSYVDVTLSEAESGYGTSGFTLSYSASDRNNHPAPVVTPEPSYSSDDGSYPGALSEITLSSAADQSSTLVNRNTGIFTPPRAPSSQTTVSLLYQLIAKLQGASSPPANIGTDLNSKQRAEFALLEDLQKASQFRVEIPSQNKVEKVPKYRVDVVLLQSRDVDLDAIGPGYTDYNMCQGDKNPSLCQMRSAIDRIFWKGDYLEYVAVTGKNLKDLLNASGKLMAEQAQLADTGPTGQWLISFGIVQSALTNVTEINQNNEPVWIPVDPSCKGQAGSQSTYCVGGTPIADDAYYWLLTTDQLAQDKAIYGILQNLPAANHRSSDAFVTAPLSRYLLANLSTFVAQTAPPASPAGSRGSSRDSSPEGLIINENETYQQTRLIQVDFAKLIASFSSRQPVGGNAYVANFQGVSDARAVTPTQQSLDLEMGSRVLADWRVPSYTEKRRTPVAVGEQSAFTYNRAVLGNLTPATRPINASYSLNNITAGGFIQVRLDGGGGVNSVRAARSLPRDLLVFTPHQYQVEVNHPYLFFPFAASSTTPGELTIQLPRTSGWTDRAGFRREFGAAKSTSLFKNGSYFETGLEYSVQNNVLASLTLNTGANTKTCNVSATITLQTCFSQSPSLTINSSTKLVGLPLVKDLRSPGLYWQIHFQNHLLGNTPATQISLVTDSQGDYYFGRGSSAELPTQTEYAIPLSLALVLPSIGNLSFAPTYSGFFYQSQLNSNSLKVNSFSLAARWYFARDARVPIHRQAPLTGPPSADQTRTGSGH